ncbi:MAG: hypothetical protein NTW48_04215 [Chloroflexi bacterium]|nr:hypothetical protein [Chloroflexota bacterium]
MKRIEGWFLDRFVPWFKLVSIFIAILVVAFGISWLLHTIFEWEIITTGLLIAFLEYGLYFLAKQSRIKRRINILVEEELENLPEDAGAYGPEIDRIISVIIYRLREEGFEDPKGESDTSIHSDVIKAVRHGYYALKHRKTHQI